MWLSVTCLRDRNSVRMVSCTIGNSIMCNATVSSTGVNSTAVTAHVHWQTVLMTTCSIDARYVAVRRQFSDRCFRWYASIYSNSNTAAYCYGTDCRRCWKSLQCDYDRHRIVWCLMNHYDQTNNLYLRRHWHSHTLSVCGCAYQLCWM